MQSAPLMLIQVAGRYAGFERNVTGALEEREIDCEYQECLNGAENEGGAQQAGKGAKGRGVQPLAPADFAPQQVCERDAVDEEQGITGNHTEAPAYLLGSHGDSHGRVETPTGGLAAPVSDPGFHRAETVLAGSRKRSIWANIQFGSSHMMKCREVSVTAIRTPSSLAYWARRLASVVSCVAPYSL